MKYILSVLVSLFLVVSVASATEINLGEPLSLTEITTVSEINKNPDMYRGKRVLVEGLVVEVCSSRGCWMNIASDVPFQKIKIKVVDGEIVFPLEAKGRLARVEGIVEEMKLSKSEAIALGEHQAEERGTSFDPASVTGPVNYFRIRGLGAIIE